MASFTNKLNKTLNEVFHAIPNDKVEFEEWPDGQIVSSFYIGNHQYIVAFSPIKPGFVNVSFDLVTEPGSPEGLRAPHERTGHGAIPILNNVIKIIDSYINEFKPRGIGISPNDMRLSLIYDRLVRRLRLSSDEYVPIKSDIRNIWLIHQDWIDHFMARHPDARIMKND